MSNGRKQMFCFRPFLYARIAATLSDTVRARVTFEH